MSEIAEMPDTSFGSAYSTLHDDLGYQKVCARWVPRQLTDTHRQQYREMTTQFLQHHETDLSLLDGIVTGNETWVHHFGPAIKRESMERKNVECYESCSSEVCPLRRKSC